LRPCGTGREPEDSDAPKEHWSESHAAIVHEVSVYRDTARLQSNQLCDEFARQGGSRVRRLFPRGSLPKRVPCFAARLRAHESLDAVPANDGVRSRDKLADFYAAGENISNVPLSELVTSGSCFQQGRMTRDHRSRCSSRDTMVAERVSDE
jgi:hypothetical protein